MKQHITEVQLNELTIEQSAKLMYSFGNDELAGGEDVTIGKMIEILENIETEGAYNRVDVDYSKNSCYIWIFSYDEEMSCITDEYSKDVATNILCDALWEAVKEIL